MDSSYLETKGLKKNFKLEFLRVSLYIYTYKYSIPLRKKGIIYEIPRKWKDFDRKNMI